MFPEQPWNKGM